MVSGDSKKPQSLPPASMVVFFTFHAFVTLPALAVLPLRVPGFLRMTTGQWLPLLAVIAAAEATHSRTLVRLILPQPQLRWHPAFATGAWLASLAAAMLFMFPPGPASAPVGICSVLALALSVDIIGAIWLLLLANRGVVSDWSRTGVVLGTLAGLIGFTVQEMACPDLRVQHQLVSHLCYVALTAGLGWVLGSVADGTRSV